MFALRHKLFYSSTNCPPRSAPTMGVLLSMCMYNIFGLGKRGEFRRYQAFKPLRCVSYIFNLNRITGAQPDRESLQYPFLDKGGAAPA